MIRIGVNNFIDLKDMGKGDPVLLVPLKCWLAEDMAPLANTHRVVFYDPRGRGGSTPKDPDELAFDHDVADLEILRLNLGLDRITVLGWGYYSLVAAAYASRHPERLDGIILVGTPGPSAAWWAQAIAVLQARLDMPTLDALMAEPPDEENEDFCYRWNQALMQGYFSDPRALSLMHSNPCRYKNEFPSRVNRTVGAVFASLGDWDLSGEWQSVTTPTLILHGEEDWNPLDCAKAWTTNPKAELITLQAAGNMPWLEYPGFYSQVETFLKGL